MNWLVDSAGFMILIELIHLTWLFSVKTKKFILYVRFTVMDNLYVEMPSSTRTEMVYTL